MPRAAAGRQSTYRCRRARFRAALGARAAPDGPAWARRGRNQDGGDRRFGSAKPKGGLARVSGSPFTVGGPLNTGNLLAFHSDADLPAVAVTVNGAALSFSADGKIFAVGNGGIGDGGVAMFAAM